MKLENLVLVEYQENFADNLSSIAYAKILEEKTNAKCYLENDIKKRKIFENKMSNFNLEYEFISSTRVQNFSKLALDNNKFFLNTNKTKKINNKIISLKHFNIDDKDLISDNIKNMLKFNKCDFIVNYDILEDIVSTQSIGLYINKNDINTINNEFIYNATKRLNKYIKKPKLYIFSDNSIKDKINSFIDYEILSINDWREEFYFLTACKHKIILNTKNSYSEGFWAAVLNEKEYCLNIYDKKIKTIKKRNNWIAM